MADFPCRTKVISGTSYKVQWFAPDGSLRISSSMWSKEHAERELNKPSVSGYTVKITPVNWTKTVCIECGEEGIG